MKRTIWFWVYFIVAIVLATYFSVRVIMTGMGHGDLSRVRSISISADIADKDMSALADPYSLPAKRQKVKKNFRKIPFPHTTRQIGVYN